MKRIDSRPIPDNSGEIRCFLVVRNEALRLPSTMKHHRALGVHRFFVVDNGSTDGTLDYVLAQPDVHVFSTADSYSQSHCGITWTNALLDCFGSGHWTLTIDADEQFIYPHYEEVGLPAFCNYLESIGSDMVACLMLDMYSKSSIQDAVHNPDGSLLETCRYFDRESYQMIRIVDPPYIEIHGGVRERMFKDVQVESPPSISKAPLVRWRPGAQYLLSTHRMSLAGARLSPILGALLHFKFLSDFHESVQIAVARGEHWKNARAYRVYLQILQQHGQVNLYSENSEKFKDSMQLVTLGLMATSQGYEQYAQVTNVIRSAQEMAGLPAAV